MNRINLSRVDEVSADPAQSSEISRQTSLVKSTFRIPRSLSGIESLPSLERNGKTRLNKSDRQTYRDASFDRFAVSQIHRPAGTVPNSSETKLRPDPLRVLLLDPHAFHRRLGSICLEQFGYQVDAFADAEVALLAYGDHDYGLVLVKLLSTGSDRFETIHRIRQIQDHQLRRVPIVVVTGDPATIDSQNNPPGVVDGYLTLPFREQEFRRVIDEVNPPVASSKNPWSLDPEQIRASFPMSQSAMVTVVDLFRESCDEKIKVIRQAIACEDSDEVARSCHALRGALGMFATSKTLKIVIDLESAVNRTDPNQASILLLQLEEAINRLHPTLEKLVENRDDSV